MELGLMQSKQRPATARKVGAGQRSWRASLAPAEVPDKESGGKQAPSSQKF